MEDDIFKGLGVEVKLQDAESFLKVKETLTRIGIVSNKDIKKLIQSCHILHKQGRYSIFHFKELFALDGKQTNFSDEDRQRRNTIALLLNDWKLVNVVKPELIENDQAPLNHVKIISFAEKKDYVLEAKYAIGRTRKA